MWHTIYKRTILIEFLYFLFCYVIMTQRQDTEVATAIVQTVLLFYINIYQISIVRLEIIVRCFYYKYLLQ